MTDLDERIRQYATASLAASDPVSPEEARGRASGRWRRSPWLPVLAVAAMVAVIAGVTGTGLFDEGDEQNVTARLADMPLTLDGHRDWVLAMLNGEVEASDAELRARYSEDFLEAVPPARFRRTSKQVLDMAPWALLQEIERREDVLVVQLGGAGDEQARLTLMVGEDGRVVASTILMAVPCAEPILLTEPLKEPLARQLEWVKAQLASGSELPEEELETRFAPNFLEAVPPDRLAAGFDQLRELGPYTYRHYEGAPTATSLTMRVGVRTGEEARLVLAIEARAPHRITGFEIRTQQPCSLRL